MLKLTAVSIALLATVLFAGCSETNQQITLRFNTDVGVRQVHEQQTKSTWKVTEADSIKDEGSGITRYTSIENVIALSPDSTIEIVDSSIIFREIPNPEKDRKLDTIPVHRVYTYKIRPDGEFVDIRSADPADSSKLIWLKEFYQQGWPRLPHGTVGVGSSWAHTTPVKMPEGTVDATTTYTLTSLVRESGYDCAVIEYSGDVLLPFEGYTKDNKYEVGVERTTVSGVMYFAYNEGIIVLTRDRWKTTAERDYICHEESDTTHVVVNRENNVEYRLTEYSKL